jgi:hypothetical protein
MVNQSSSFSDVVEGEADRLLIYVFGENKDKGNIKDFSDFREKFLRKFNSPNGKNAMVDEEDLIKLFQTPECKKIMREQVSEKEYDNLYGDGIVVKREPIPDKRFGYTETISKKVKVTRGTKTYSRTNTKWSGSQEEFIKVRKQKKISNSQIIKEFEERYKEKNPKTHSAIRNKIYRI